MTVDPTRMIDHARTTLDGALRGIRETVTSACPDGAWVVGGAVRDALLERPILDLDIVVDGSAETAACAVSNAVDGAPFQLNDRHGCWRIMADGHPQIDVCQLRGTSIDDDLLLRDFTINAIAMRIDDTLTLTDTTGGIAHLDGELLSMVAARAFNDDPLRLLRAVRIAHELDFAIAPDTRAAIHQHAHQAADPSGERIFVELCRLIEQRQARRGLRLLDELGLLDVLLPELAACRGLEQSRFHHLDVFEHTLAVIDNVEDIIAAHAFWLPTGDATVHEFTPEQRRMLLFAAMCHDLAKPATRTIRDDGRVSFVGHDEVGTQIVATLCERWATSARFRTGLQHLVRTHLALGFMLHRPLDARAIWRFLRHVEPHAAEAIVLSVADRLATAGPDDRREWVRRHLQVARELWHAHWREVRDGRPAPLLDGREIADLIGREPGPIIGELVHALAEAQAVGDVRTVAEARDLVRSCFEVSESTASTP